ncbi:MAG: S-layer family protein [Phycisphaerales bacterium]|nr:S-layer family protein [Phycisphaerales bacterium]
MATTSTLKAKLTFDQTVAKEQAKLVAALTACSSVTSPLTATANPVGSKMGEAKVSLLFGTIPLKKNQDGGVYAAAKNGGITSTASTTTTQGIIRTSGDTAGFGIITLADDTTIDTTNNGGTAAGATITLGGTVDGAGFDLTLNSGTTGDLAINNAIGGGGAIGLLTITGNNISFDANTTSTGLLVTAQGNVTVGAGDTVNFGAVASTITSNGTLSAGAGAAVDGGAALTLRPLAVTDGIDVGNDAQGATTGLNVLKSFVSVVSANVTDLELGYAGTQTGQIVINENTDLLVATNLTVHAGGGLLAANNITLSGAGDAITVNGNTSFGGGGTWTTNAGDITLDGTLAMADGSTVNLLSTGGDVEVTGTINGITDNDNETLVINAGVGGIILGGNVGGTIPLGTLQLFANDMTFPTLITATNAQLSAGTAGGLIGVEHNGDLDLTIVDHLERLAVTNLTIGDVANTGGITAGTDNDLEDALYNITILSNTGNITLAGNYSSINGSSLTLDTTGNIVIDAGLDIDIDGAFTAQNAAAMSLGAWITTTNDNITINAPLTLTDDVELNTGSGAGNIVFGSTIDGTQELTLSAGTGNLTISGAVGGGTVLTSLVVESATTTTTDAINVNSLLSFTSDEVNFGGGAGTVSGATIEFAPSSGTVTAILIGNNGADAGAANFDLNDTDIAALADGFTSITIGDAGSTLPITIHSSGATFSDSLTLNADGVGGSVLVSGDLSTAGNNDAATLTINGSGATTTLEANLITEGGAITINDAVVLDGAILLDTTNGGADAAGANITFDTPGTILDVGFQTSTLTLRAGTGGDVSVAGDIGSVPNRLSDLTIVSAHDATFDGVVLVAGLLQSAGTGTTTFNSTVSSNGNNISLTTGEVVLNDAPMTTSGGGNITITGAFTVDDASAISSNGSFSQSGGAVSLGSNISTTNSGITIGGALTLTENVTLAAGTAVNATAALDDVSAGTNNLTITADEINFGGGANSVTGTGTLTLQPNNDGDAMQLGGVDPGANTLTLDNTDLDALGAGFTLINLGRSTGTHAYSIQAGLPDPAFNDPVVFRGLTTLTLAGTLAVDDDITFDGPLTLSANGNAITTTGDDITINGDLTVSDGNSPIITTQGGADADITINGEINGTPGGGAESITLTAGNDVTLEGDVVIDTFNVNFGQTAGGVLTIENTVTQIDATTITFTGGAADDILRINNPVGDILRTPTGGIDFDGAAQATADALEILGGSADTEVYDVGPANDEGTITFNNGGPDLLTIDFAGLEPILDTVAIVNFTINGDGADNTIDLDDGTAAADGRVRVSIDAFETIEFANKTNLTIDGLGGNDTLNWTATELPTGVESWTLNSETINLPGGTLQTDGSQTYNGQVVLTSNAQFVTVDIGSSVVFNGGIDAGAGNDVLITSEEIDFGAAVTGTGNLTLRPLAVGDSIGVAGAAGDLQLTLADIGNIADGWANIIIGYAGTASM